MVSKLHTGGTGRRAVPSPFTKQIKSREGEAPDRCPGWGSMILVCHRSQSLTEQCECVAAGSLSKLSTHTALLTGRWHTNSTPPWAPGSALFASLPDIWGSHSHNLSPAPPTQRLPATWATREQGLFSLVAAHASARQSLRR